MEDTKKDPSQLSVMKTILREVKNTFSQINSRLNMAEKKISELKGIAIETIQNETENF